MAWQAMKDWLREAGVDAANPKDTFAGAYTNRLITDESGWSEMQIFRNKTSHTYDEAKALEVVAFVRATAVGLFDELAARLKSL
jgi:nucleotidyltransferase substrate binding protein (TIGR01987 family)